MRIGESKKLSDWVSIIEKGCIDYRWNNNGNPPDTVSVDQELYLELCAAAGSLIKSVNGMKIMVRWGGAGVK